MIDPDGEGAAPPFSGRAAYVISQSYYYVAAVVGVGLLLGGAIAALIALRQWLLPSTDASYGSGPDSSRVAVRSLLGALAFVVVGAGVFAWHIREARRREGAYRSGTFWGSALYFHLVALIALAITIGGTIGGLMSLRDAALPYCYDQPTAYPPVATPMPGLEPGSEVSIPPEAVEALSELRRECYPPASDALRNAIDAAIVTAVAGGVWLWHLGRARREAAIRSSAPTEGPPPEV